MPKRWEDRWVRDDSGKFRGGQSISFVARPTAGDGPPVFIKTLRRVRDLRARRRFKREVGAYEALAGLGLPELFDHNAETFQDARTPMYMAMELIDGINLQDFIQRGERPSVEAALACVRELAEVLNRCHESDVAHRDVKPANVVLRGNDITKPVLVDFGLSFNHADDELAEVTEQNEEVGNRFLRLPEHSTGGRARASDVTQLAGIFIYIITGHEPRVLRDEFDQMPHQRPEARNAFVNLLAPRQILRLMSVFDRAFAHDLSTRYASAPELISALERAMQIDQEGGDDYEQLLARVDEIAVSQGLPDLAARRKSIEQLTNSIVRIFQDFALSRGLQWARRTTSGQVYVHVTSDEAWQQASLSVHAPDGAGTFAMYRVERRGASEHVVLVDGEEIWRGPSTNELLNKAIQMAAAKQFLATQAVEP
jgi:serine/threonine protein kinase